MKILITGGGTSEKIDDVRSITNHSTGRLGKELVTTFSEDYCCDVFYIYGNNSLVPVSKPNVHLFPIVSVDDLDTTIDDLCSLYSFDVVIHSMAVSDYKVQNTLQIHEVASLIANKLSTSNALSKTDYSTVIYETLQKEFTNNQVLEKKISSNDSLLMALQPTQKIINKFHYLLPDAVLVGFKLLVDVSETNLIEVGYNLLKKNKCTFVLANDLTTINNEDHTAFLIDSNKNYQMFHSKKEISSGIANAVFQKLEERK